MTDYEKKAIEYLNMYADDMENRVYDGDTTWNIKRVLNLISKLQKENELLKEQKEYVINEYGETIEKQSKVIDEMAKYIDKNVEIINKQIDEEICCHNKDGKCINRKCFECIKQYFYRKVE